MPMVYAPCRVLHENVKKKKKKKKRKEKTAKNVENSTSNNFVVSQPILLQVICSRTLSRFQSIPIWHLSPPCPLAEIFKLKAT